jgi:PPOX class probable F420-dependent enzyme
MLEFLGRPWIARLGVVRADGTPLVVPMTYSLADDGDILLHTGATSAKAQAMRHQPQVCFSVDDDQPPYAFVRVDANAEIIEDMDVVREVSRAIAQRYHGPEQVEARVARNAVPGVVAVRLRPIRLVGMAELAA